jgi:hypothetical protein
MKIKKSPLFAALAFGLATILPAFAQAADILDPGRLAIIQQQCTVLQTALDQLQRRDLVARTNRGREYESIITQLTAFSQRLRNNNKPSADLDKILNDFKTTVDNFRSGYIQYDNSMNALSEVDCRNHPADFAVDLQQTSILRQQVGAEVVRGEQHLASYRQAIVDLQAQLSVEGSR